MCHCFLFVSITSASVLSLFMLVFYVSWTSFLHVRVCGSCDGHRSANRRQHIHQSHSLNLDNGGRRSVRWWKATDDIFNTNSPSGLWHHQDTSQSRSPCLETSALYVLPECPSATHQAEPYPTLWGSGEGHVHSMSLSLNKWKESRQKSKRLKYKSVRWREPFTV